MKITIEVNDNEKAATIVQQQDAGVRSGTTTAEAAPIDGGSPPESLLAALGEASGTVSDGLTDQPNGNAGEPSRSLVESMASSAPIRSGAYTAYGFSTWKR